MSSWVNISTGSIYQMSAGAAEGRGPGSVPQDLLPSPPCPQAKTGFLLQFIPLFSHPDEPKERRTYLKTPPAMPPFKINKFCPAGHL
jgi:hypothetical protein